MACNFDIRPHFFMHVAQKRTNEGRDQGKVDAVPRALDRPVVAHCKHRVQNTEDQERLRTRSVIFELQEHLGRA